MGGLTNMARFNEFQNNCFRDAWLILIGDTVFSLLSGLTVFALLGFIAKEANMVMDESVDHLAVGGPRLTFIILTAGIMQITSSKGGKMTMKFFYSLMMLSLGLDAVLCSMDNIIGAFTDKFKVLRKKKGK